MRISAVLVIIILALIGLGALGVDESYVRQDLTQLQEENRQLKSDSLNYKTQLDQQTGIIQACQTQEAHFNQDRATLNNQIASITSQNQELQGQIEQLKNNIHPSDSFFGIGLVGLLGAMTTGTSIFVVNRYYRNKRFQQPTFENKQLKTVYVYITEEEAKGLAGHHYLER